MEHELASAGLRVTLDERDERPGWKFAEWELRGVPLRLEIGPKDIEKSAVLIARRDTREKQSIPMGGLADKLREHRLVQVLYNLPAGNWPAGERGVACLPDRTAEFAQGIDRSIEYSSALGCTQINCLAGIVPSGLSQGDARRTFVDKDPIFFGSSARDDGVLTVDVVSEPLDRPGATLVVPRWADASSENDPFPIERHRLVDES